MYRCVYIVRLCSFFGRLGKGAARGDTRRLCAFYSGVIRSAGEVAEGRCPLPEFLVTHVAAPFKAAGFTLREDG